MFPKEAYTGNWMVAFRLVIPIYMVMALSQFITYLLILIVGEKENHIKEGMKIMGLRDSVFWSVTHRTKQTPATNNCFLLYFTGWRGSSFTQYL